MSIILFTGGCIQLGSPLDLVNRICLSLYQISNHRKYFIDNHIERLARVFRNNSVNGFTTCGVSISNSLDFLEAFVDSIEFDSCLTHLQPLFCPFCLWPWFEVKYYKRALIFDVILEG